MARKRLSTGLDVGLQDVVDAVDHELVVIDKDYRVRLVNAAARRKFGMRADASFGGRCYEVLHGRSAPCSLPMWDCPLGPALTSGAGVCVIHADESPGKTSERYVEICAYPLRDSEGNLSAVVEMRRDLSVQRELETQVLRRHHELRALSHISGVLGGLWDLDEMLNMALNTLLELTGDAIGGMLLLDESMQALSYRAHRGLSPEFVEGMTLRLGEGVAGRVAQTGEALLIEDISRDPRAARRDLLNTEGLRAFVSVPLTGKDKVLGVMNLASHIPGHFGPEDISLMTSIGRYLGTAIEEVRLYDRLRQARERYQALMQHSLRAQEDERRRIARELHDETSQAITSLTLNLQALIGLADVKGIDDADFIEKLKKTHSYAVYAGNEIVRLMKELRPTLLDELGLVAAIRQYARDNLEPRGVGLSLEFECPDDLRLPGQIDIALYRIAQGAIGNIIQHAGARRASIRLVVDSKECLLEIHDDGRGFDVNKVTRVEPTGRGAGLFTMLERAKLLGGACWAESSPGKGTKIVARIPLEGDMEGEEDPRVGR